MYTPSRGLYLGPLTTTRFPFPCYWCREHQKAGEPHLPSCLADPSLLLESLESRCRLILLPALPRLTVVEVLLHAVCKSRARTPRVTGRACVVHATISGWTQASRSTYQVRLTLAWRLLLACYCCSVCRLARISRLGHRLRRCIGCDRRYRIRLYCCGAVRACVELCIGCVGPVWMLLARACRELSCFA